jgi:hypothetical protein
MNNGVNTHFSEPVEGCIRNIPEQLQKSKFESLSSGQSPSVSLDSDAWHFGTSIEAVDVESLFVACFQLVTELRVYPTCTWNDINACGLSGTPCRGFRCQVRTLGNAADDCYIKLGMH